MEKPKNVIETGEYVEPHTFENESEAVLFFSYLEPPVVEVESVVRVSREKTN